MSFKSTIGLLLITLTMTGCASLEEARRRSDERFRQNYCSYEGAYVLGTNDVRNDHAMRVNVASRCDVDIQDEVRHGYRDGYTEAQRNRPVNINIENHTLAPKHSPVRPHHQHTYACHKDAEGQKVCGYNCTKLRSHWYCGQTPDEVCQAKGSVVRCQSTYS